MQPVAGPLFGEELNRATGSGGTMVNAGIDWCRLEVGRRLGGWLLWRAIGRPETAIAAQILLRRRRDAVRGQDLGEALRRDHKRFALCELPLRRPVGPPPAPSLPAEPR